MKLHANASLTIKQREEVWRLHHEENMSIRKLAEKFGVNESTIQRWTGREVPLDKTSAPLCHRTVITPEYRAAVVAFRQAHPAYGPLRIAEGLRAAFPFVNRGTILRILQEEHLTRPPKKERKQRTPIPVGHHRIQMDVQQLPAIEGEKGFEYKISMVHLRTRYKYSEIHRVADSETVAEVLRRGLRRLPPFFSSGPTTP
jgi:hypothetical protein